MSNEPSGHRVSMKHVASQFVEAARWVRESISKLSIRRDSAPIDSVERVCHFARTRAALISQKKLYGYLKERMGTRYPKMFTDEIFVQSINVAKLHVYAASLADLTCFCVANATGDPAFTNDDRDRIARECFRAGIEENTGEASQTDRQAWIDAFDARLAKTVWSMRRAGGQHFIECGPALIRWAPIAEELKRYDREIVENSIRYAFVEVRTDFLNRLDGVAVAGDWRRIDG